MPAIVSRWPFVPRAVPCVARLASFVVRRSSAPGCVALDEPRTRTPQHAPVPNHIPATAGFWHRPPRAPDPPKKHPAAPQEFFRKNSYCARGPGFRASSGAPANPRRSPVAAVSAGPGSVPAPTRRLPVPPRSGLRTGASGRSDPPGFRRAGCAARGPGWWVRFARSGRRWR